MPLPPRISIVTPSYNQAQFLEECIDSVLSQGYPNLEYVIMDGGSTDGSVEIIKRYEKHLTYWQSSPDGGQYAAINAGFAHTSGEIMAWLNSDDRYHPNAFLKVATAFAKHPEANWLTGRACIFKENGEIDSIETYFPHFSRLKMLSGHIDKPFIMQEATFWRRTLWEKSGAALNTKYKLAADTELWLRFFRTDQLIILDALLGGFRKQANNRSVQNIQKYHEEARMAVEDEREFLTKDLKPILTKHNFKISTTELLHYSKFYNIPRFNPTNKPFFRTYLQSMQEWILENKGGLELAHFLLDEIVLWEESSEYDFQNTKSTLNYQIGLRNSAEKLIADGEYAYHSGDIDAAIKKTSEALGIWKTSAIGNNNLAVMLYKTGKIQKALEQLILVRQLDASMSEAYRNIALIFYELNELDKVKWALDYYLACFPEDIEMENFYRRLMEWR